MQVSCRGSSASGRATSVNSSPSPHSTASPGIGPRRIFGPHRSCRTAISRPSSPADRADRRERGRVLLVRAVREVEPEDVDPRLDQPPQHVRVARRRPDRRHDLGPDLAVRPRRSGPAASSATRVGLLLLLPLAVVLADLLHDGRTIEDADRDAHVLGAGERNVGPEHVPPAPVDEFRVHRAG